MDQTRADDQPAAGHRTGRGTHSRGGPINGERTLPTSNRIDNPPNPDNRYLDYSYAPDGVLDSVTSPDPQDLSGNNRQPAQQTVYDGAGRPTSLTAGGHTVTTSYYLDGLVKQVTDTAGDAPHRQSYGYDDNGRQTTLGTLIEGSDQTETRDYTADDLLRSVQNAAGDKTSYSYDDAGNTLKVYSPNANSTTDDANTANTPTRYTYTDDNLAKTVIVPVSPNGSTRRRTTYGYDLAGRRTTTDVDLVTGVNDGDPTSVGAISDHGPAQQLSYYPNDTLAVETGRAGETAAHAYDAAGNLTTLTYTPATGPVVTTTGTYYLDGLARSITERGRTTRYAYDGAGATAARTDVNGSTSTLTKYAYTDAGQVHAVNSDVNGNADVTFDYDAVARPRIATYPNGTSWTRIYNADATLQEQNLTKSGTSIADWRYTYDGKYRVTAAGLNVTGALDCSTAPVPAGLQCFRYNAADRLSLFHDRTAKRDDITYDPDGNRLTYGAGDNSTAAPTAHQKYNADDSISESWIGGTGAHKNTQYWVFGGIKTDGCKTYTYDGFDRLLQAAGNGSTGCTFTSDYTYDGLGRQTTQTQSTSAPSAGSTQTYYDGWNSSIAEESNADSSIDQYTLAGGTPTVVKRSGAAGGTQYLAGDGRTSLVTATNAAGALVCQARFDPWGSPLDVASTRPDQICTNAAGGVSFTPLGYGEQRRDTATGNYQLGERTYDPSKAGFLTSDTYSSGSGAQAASVGADPLTRNTYSYVNGDPVNLTDPNGHRPPCDPGDDCAEMVRAWQRASARGERELWNHNIALRRLRAVFGAIDSSTDEPIVPLLVGSIVPGAGGGTPADFAGDLKVQALLDNPQLLEGLSPDDVLGALGELPSNWRIERLRQGTAAGRGFALRQYLRDGATEGNGLIRWSPGGGRHGDDPYWRVTTPQGAKVRGEAGRILGSDSSYWKASGDPAAIMEQMASEGALESPELPLGRPLPPEALSGGSADVPMGEAPVGEGGMGLGEILGPIGFIITVVQVAHDGFGPRDPCYFESGGQQYVRDSCLA